MRTALVAIFISWASLAYAGGVGPIVNADMGCTVAGQALIFNGTGIVCAPPASAKTVATLPTCDAGNTGLSFIVSDALTPSALASVSSGGAVGVRVTCDGSAWKVM